MKIKVLCDDLGIATCDEGLQSKLMTPNRLIFSHVCISVFNIMVINDNDVTE